jgi:hypothetical protein
MGFNLKCFEVITSLIDIVACRHDSKGDAILIFLPVIDVDQAPNAPTDTKSKKGKMEFLVTYSPPMGEGVTRFILPQRWQDAMGDCLPVLLFKCVHSATSYYFCRGQA